MAKIVDYLRKENEEVEIPTTCRVSADLDGVVYDLRDTPHNEVMQFCKKLAWVNGEAFDHYYGQYVKTGRIIDAEQKSVEDNDCYDRNAKNLEQCTPIQKNGKIIISFITYVQAEEKEKAIKIARDRWAEYKAKANDV
jgi:hypothetical protein